MFLTDLLSVGFMQAGASRFTPYIYQMAGMTYALGQTRFLLRAYTGAQAAFLPTGTWQQHLTSKQHSKHKNSETTKATGERWSRWYSDG